MRYYCDKHNQKGFGLFEVLVSLFIFSIVLLGFAEAQSRAYQKICVMHQQISRYYHDLS